MVSNFYTPQCEALLRHMKTSLKITKKNWNIYVPEKNEQTKCQPNNFIISRIQDLDYDLSQNKIGLSKGEIIHNINCYNIMYENHSNSNIETILCKV
jgi:hypothetical protein